MKKELGSEIDIDETDIPEEEEEDVVTYDINYYPADITIKGYLDKFEQGTILVPEFQRGYVWSQVQASKLIESFLRGLPVPGVFLYQHRKTKKLQIVDGQQRILSCVYFLQGIFQEKKFRLQGVLSKWNGKSFGELSEPERLQLQDSVLRATIIQQLEPSDDSSIYHIFERLNTGGVNLSPMEIRKCVYHGDLFRAMERCNSLASWRSLVGQSQPDKRLRDIEFILRILALHAQWRQYKKPMKWFLSGYMTAVNKDASFDVATLEQQFQSACDYVLASCGKEPFHLRGRINLAAMDSVMCAAIDAVALGVGDFGDRYARLKSDEAYIKDVTISTSDETVLKSRFGKAYQSLCS